MPVLRSAIRAGVRCCLAANVHPASRVEPARLGNAPRSGTGGGGPASSTLRRFAERQAETSAFWDADLATGIAFFQEARRRLSAEGPASAHHLDLTADGEWSRPQAFLVVEPAQSLSDGAARVASSGYFDVNNVPPWVTAVPPRAGYEQTPGLLCWVPQWAHKHVERGIEVNPEGVCTGPRSETTPWSGVEEPLVSAEVLPSPLTVLIPTLAGSIRPNFTALSEIHIW